MTLHLVKRLVHFGGVQRQNPRKFSADALYRPDEGIEQRTYCSCGTQTLHDTTTTEVSTEPTHPATSSPSAKSPCPPCVPPELLSLVLIELWEAQQTPEERSVLLQNTVSVNRTWLMLMARIASCDVHISDTQNASIFVWLLSMWPESPRPTAKEAGPFTRERSRFANEMCRSISFYVDGRTSPPCSPTRPPPSRDASDAISFVLHTISTQGGRQYLPNLRHISFRYMDMGHEDIFKHLEQEPFPPQVARLSIDYAFTDRQSKYTLYEQWLCTRDKDRGYAPLRTETGRGVAAAQPPVLNVRRLSLSGVVTQVVAAILRVCPNVGTLALPVPCPVYMDEIAPLPPALRTLVLQHPGPATLARLRRSAEEEWYWELSFILGGGLFPRAVGGGRITATKPRPRLIVRPSVHHPALYVALRRSCNRAKVKFVYECDDFWS